MKQELVDQFGISRLAVTLSHGSMYLHLGLLPIWPHWTKVQSSICLPSSPSPTQRTFVSWTQRSCAVNHLPPYLVGPRYKSHTTLNGLVGIARNGAFILVSQIFSAAIGDNQDVKDILFLRSSWRLYQLAAASWQTGPLKSRIPWGRTIILY